MPGIVGIIRKTPSDKVRQDLSRMIESMRHEEFYVSGSYVNEDIGLYAGWICHRGSFSDCMPLPLPGEDKVVIFQGENHVTPEVRRQLLKANSATDFSSARYLAELYRQGPEQFLLALNGWYCGLIADVARRKVTLFNDRYAMGRIYFHEGPDEFIFASEAKALLAIRPKLRAIDPEGLADYLRYNCVTEDRTFFKGVSLLPHASAFEFENGTLAKRRRYFDFTEWEGQDQLGKTEFYSRFVETVSDVVPPYASKPSDVGLSLTAGLDTRLVMGALGKRNGQYSCYTFGGRWGELYDVRTARKLSKVYDKTFNAITINRDFLRDFGSYATKAVHISDGTHDAFGAHDVFFNQMAREIAPIRLTGKFGSEVVRTRKLVDSLTYPERLFCPNFASIIRQRPSFDDKNFSDHPLTRVLTKDIPWHEFGRNYVEQSQLILRTPYMDNALVKLMYNAPRGSRKTTDLQEAYIREKSPEISRIPTNMGRLISPSRVVTTLMDVWYRALFKVEYIYLYATPHWLTRMDRCLHGLRLERLLSGRQKWEGYRLWINTDFGDFIRQTLFSATSQFDSFFQKATVKQMVERHIAGTHNYMPEINKALTIELMCSSLLRP